MQEYFLDLMIFFWYNSFIMKKDLHPIYDKSTITCSCGNVIETRSTKPNIKVEICSACHPLFTGKQKLVDTAGRVDKFLARQKAALEVHKARELKKEKSKRTPKLIEVEEKIGSKTKEGSQ